MTIKSFAGALALAAVLCMPALTATTTVASAESRIVTKTNFNSVGKSTTKAGVSKARRKTVSVSKRKARKASRGHKNPAIVAKVKSHARKAGVPVSTALAVVRQESGFRPHVTGAAGEIGLMQLKCQTARGMGFSGSCKALYNPDTNLRYGMKYLRKALNRGSVAYYNAGIHAKKLPRAARRYAASVAGHEG